MKTSTLARKVPVLTAGGVIAVAVALGGTAAADALPAPLQNVAHTVFGAPAPPRPAAPLPSRIRHSPQFGNGRTTAPSVAAAPSPSPLKSPETKHTSTAKAQQKAAKKAAKAQQKAAKKAATATAQATRRESGQERGEYQPAAFPGGQCPDYAFYPAMHSGYAPRAASVRGHGPPGLTR